MIADVGDSLLRLLRAELSDLTDQRIALVSPGDVDLGAVRLGLFLYSVAECASLRNEPGRVGAGAVDGAAPIFLDLHYLLTAYPPSGVEDRSVGWLDAHRVLARAIGVLDAFGSLPPSRLSGALQGWAEPVHVSPVELSLDDLTRLWQAFPNRSLTPSVGYLVTPVPVLRSEGPSAPRVVERRDDHVSGEG